MRRLLGSLGIFAALVGFPVSLVALVAASQLDSVTESAKPEPQPMRLTDLVKNGPGDNAYVELTEFTFGKPVIVEKDAQWDAVWIPLLAPRRVRGEIPPFLHTALVHDQAELDALLAQNSVRVLVGSAMGDSRWNVPPAVKLYSDYPKLDPAKAIVVTDPALVVEGKVILPPERLLNPAIARLSWIVAGAAAAGAVLGLFAWLVARRNPRPQGVASPADLLDPGRLPEEQPISRHEFLADAAFKRVLGLGACIIICLVIGVVILMVAANFYKKGDSKAAIGGLIIGGFILLAAVAMVFVVAQELFFPITKIAVYRGGVRWQRGKRLYTALWSDIAAIYRQETDYYYNGEFKGTFKFLTLELHNGTNLRVDGMVLTDYESFANHVQSVHGGMILKEKLREQAESGRATFGDISVGVEGVIIGGTFVPWSRLQRFEVANGHLSFYSSQFAWSKVRTYALKAVPNYAVLLDMLRSKAMCY
jgi:hypothetical protein